MKDINLLPDDIRASEEQVKSTSSGSSTVKVATIVIVALVLVAVTFVLPYLYIITLNTQLDMTNKAIESTTYNEVKALKSDAVKLDSKINSKNEVITFVDNESFSINQILNIINNSTPEGCLLEKVELDANTLTINGKVSDGGKASELLSNIRRINSLSVKDTVVVTKDGFYSFKYTFIFGGKEGN